MRCCFPRSPSKRRLSLSTTVSGGFGGLDTTASATRKVCIGMGMNVRMSSGVVRNTLQSCMHLRVFEQCMLNQIWQRFIPSLPMMRSSTLLLYMTKLAFTPTITKMLAIG